MASERSASRNTGRLTPSASASSRSASSRSPAFNSPDSSRSRKKVKTRAAPLCVSSVVRANDIEHYPLVSPWSDQF